jgi:hypothetical protein
MQRLLHFMPQLHALTASVYCDDLEAAQLMLRNAPPRRAYGALRVCELRASSGMDMDDATAMELAAGVATHAWLRGVNLGWAPLDTPAVLDALVDAATLALKSCYLSHECMPALARLVRDGALTELEICDHGSGQQQLFLIDAPAATLLGNALRQSSTLTTLRLYCISLWHDVAGADALLAALTGLPHLRVLDVGARKHAARRRAAPGCWPRAGRADCCRHSCAARAGRRRSYAGRHRNGSAARRAAAQQPPARAELRAQPHQRRLRKRAAVAGAACVQAACRGGELIPRAAGWE